MSESQLYALAVKAVETHNLSEAVALAERIVAANPSHLPAWILLYQAVGADQDFHAFVAGWAAQRLPEADPALLPQPPSIEALVQAAAVIHAAQAPPIKVSPVKPLLEGTGETPAPRPRAAALPPAGEDPLAQGLALKVARCSPYLMVKEGRERYSVYYRKEKVAWMMFYPTRQKDGIFTEVFPPQLEPVVEINRLPMSEHALYRFEFLPVTQKDHQEVRVWRGMDQQVGSILIIEGHKLLLKYLPRNWSTGFIFQISGSSRCHLYNIDVAENVPFMVMRGDFDGISIERNPNFEEQPAEIEEIVFMTVLMMMRAISFLW
jgi:hypothetical protein